MQISRSAFNYSGYASAVGSLFSHKTLMGSVRRDQERIFAGPVCGALFDILLVLEGMDFLNKISDEVGIHFKLLCIRGIYMRHKYAVSSSEANELFVERRTLPYSLKMLKLDGPPCT
jgi:hypothetical protein